MRGQWRAPMRRAMGARARVRPKAMAARSPPRADAVKIGRHAGGEAGSTLIGRILTVASTTAGSALAMGRRGSVEGHHVRRPCRSCILSQPAQRRFLKRQLSLPVSTMSQWCVRRSSSAVVIFGSVKTVAHSPNARFVVTISDVRS